MLIVALGTVLLGMPLAEADDVEAYLAGEVSNEIYVHVVMDLGDSNLDAKLCTYGLDCGPPFMSPAAYRHLGDMYQAGGAVTAPGIFKAVLAAVIENTLLDDIHISLLISNHAANQSITLSDAKGGGSILQGYRRLREHRTEFLTTLKSIPLLAAANTHKFQPKESYYEWLRYLQGGDVALGKNTTGNFGLPNPIPNYDGDIITGEKYLSPGFRSQDCPKLYSILFNLGLASEDEDLDRQISAELSLAQHTTFEQLLSFLHRGSADLLPQVDVDVPLWKTWVVSSRERSGKAAEYAIAGGSEEAMYVNEPQTLEENLTRALTGIVATASTGQNVSFSRDAFNQGRALDNLFISLFSPQANFTWPGNVKKLRLLSSQDVSEGVWRGSNGQFDQIVDARGMPAIESVGRDKGQLRANALTYWTDETTLPPGDGVSILDDADGRLVARGGAGQKIDGFTGYSLPQGEVARYFIGDTNSDDPVGGYRSRQLFFEPQAGQYFEAFDANPHTLQALRPLLDPAENLSDEEVLNLIKWARGQDVDNGKSSARGWIMGEILHSRPYALNYGATPGYSRSNPNIRLFFGSGDGVFHILQNTDTSGNETGREVFGFYPRELLSNIQLDHNNTPADFPRHYGVDGAPVVLRVDRNGDGTIDYSVGDEAYVYFGLRRGGSSYFALDISNPDAVPRLVWKISASSGESFNALGMTFSTPVVGRVSYNGVPEDVLVFAGGYNGGWIADQSARRGKDLGAADDAVGNAIYIVNARTGELVWKAVKGSTGTSSNTHYEHAGLVDSIPSEVSVLKTPTGIIHRLYVGDSGGALWRVDLPPYTDGDENHRRDHWFISKLADLGFDAEESGGAKTQDRRFFHAPDIVSTLDDDGAFEGVLIQSGNRADPNEILVENYLFYIKDREIISGSASVKAANDFENPPGRYHFDDFYDQTACVVGTETTTEGEVTIPCANRNLKSGWKVRFVEPGEKGLSTPLTDGGRVFASTFVPGHTDACISQPGQGQLHVLSLADATAVANKQRQYELGPGIPPGVESVGDVLYVPGGGVDLYDLDGDGLRDTEKLLPSLAPKLYRTYWREPGVDPL
jgi:type IV pilus assembly protein PilY1